MLTYEHQHCCILINIQPNQHQINEITLYVLDITRQNVREIVVSKNVSSVILNATHNHRGLPMYTLQSSLPDDVQEAYNAYQNSAHRVTLHENSL